ncbi:MAG: site-specific integrase [Thaumarchaeota archaeon]|nr:site-specific integrase [Nitrososphaerota archaeon]
MGQVNLKAEYDRLRKYAPVQTWLNELGNNSRNTVRNSLYGLYRYEKALGKNPDQLIEERSREVLSKNVKVRFKAEDNLKAFANNTKGGDSLAAWVKSFYKANHLPLEVSIQREPPKREIEKIPTNEELFKLCTIAKEALRPLLYFLIESGARIGSVLQLKYGHIRADYEANNIPCMVRFPARITKGNIPYVAFIGKDTVNSIRDYFKQRQSLGEKIANDSFLFITKNGKTLAPTTTMTRIAKLGFKVGLNAKAKGLKEFHAHILRKRAQTILEGSGIPLNWVDYLLGHVPRGSSAGAYSRPTEDQLRDSYKIALPKLAIREINTKDSNAFIQAFIKTSLRSAGYTEEELLNIDVSSLHADEYNELLTKGIERKSKEAEHKVLAKLTKNGSSQKVIRTSEIEKYINEGWDYVRELPNGKAIVKLPS